MGIPADVAVQMGRWAHGNYPYISASVWAAWILQEGGNGNPGTTPGGYPIAWTNPLNLRNEPAGDPYLWTARYGASDGPTGFAVFPDYESGLRCAVQQIEANGWQFSHLDDQQALAVIYGSNRVWDKCRYAAACTPDGDPAGPWGVRLLASYATVTGLHDPATTPPTPTPTPTPTPNPPGSPSVSSLPSGTIPNAPPAPAMPPAHIAAGGIILALLGGLLVLIGLEEI